MSHADPIAAVREEDATGRDAAIFADLRATLGVPFVNLIWRHLATMPEMLEWTWALAKPLYGSGALAEASATLRDAVRAPDGIRQPACVFRTVGVTSTDQAVIAAMLRGYNAANASNLLCLLAVQSVLAGALPKARLAAPRATAEPRGAGQALPRLPGLDELSPEVRDLVLALDQFGRLAPTQAVASLYRHLAHWPGFLAVAHAALSAPHQDGRLRHAHAEMRDRARQLATERILPLAAGSPPPASASAEAARASLDVFTRDMIARMVVMGELMLSILPE